MNAKKIVVPVDFSGLNDAALHYATTLALDTGAKLLILYVEEPASSYGGGGEGFYFSEPRQLEILRQRLDTLLPTDPRVPYEHHLVQGDPAAEIVRFAKQQEADLIVMATHGRTGITRLILGSVAERVVRRAPCPVFTLKPPAGAIATSA